MLRVILVRVGMIHYACINRMHLSDERMMTHLRQVHRLIHLTVFLWREVPL